jgi:hypothetical protein
VFFALAGTKIEIDALLSALPVVLVVALTRAGTFFVGSKIACKRTGADPLITKYAWVGLCPQAGLALALAFVLRDTFPTFGPAASVVLFGVVAFNESLAPPMLRVTLIRAGEAFKKEKVDFAAGH